MTALLVACVLAAPGSIVVRVEGPATEVVALRDRAVAAVAPIEGGRAVFEGIPEGAYDLCAFGPGVASDVVPGVRAVPGPRDGWDATLRALPAHVVTVLTEPGSTVWAGGFPFAPDAVVLPEGIRRILVDHPGRVSSPERLLRVAGPRTHEEPLESGLVVTGRAHLAGDRPLSGARVEVFVDGYATGRFSFSGPDGRFGVAGFRGDVVSLKLSAPGCADRLVRVDFPPGEERARVDVRLEAGSCAVLRILGHGGMPLHAAETVLLPEWVEIALEEPRLRANHEPARARGSAIRFAGLTPGRRYRILARCPGHRPASAASFVAPAAGRELRLGEMTLARAAKIEGTAAAGGGLTAVCQGPEGLTSQRTDRLGRFRFESLDPGEHVVWIRDFDERGVVVPLDDAGTARLAFPEPEETRSMTGLVLDADHAPLAGVEVEAAGRRARTGADGRFELAGLPPGPDRFALSCVPAAGCRALVADPHLPHVERKAAVGADLRIRLQRAARLRLRLDPGDRRLVRARLHVDSAGELSLQRQVPRGADEILLEEIPAGPCVVEVAAPGLLGTGGAIVQAETQAEAVPLPLLPGRSARGSVWLRRTAPRPGQAPLVADAPLDRGWVTLLDGDPLRVLATTPVEADGTFLLQGLPPGPVLLAAAVPGLPVAVTRVDLEDGDAEDVRIHLEPPAEAAIVVTGDGGRPLPEARVRVVTEHGVDLRDLVARGRFLQVVASDADAADVAASLRLERGPGGRVSAPFLQPGSYRFLVTADGYGEQRVGVRARDAASLHALRDLPGVPEDWASPVRLVPAPPDGAAAKD